MLPAETGADGADLKKVAGTKFETGSVLVDQLWIYKYVADITITGATTVGDAKLTIEQLAPDGVTVIDTLDILTSISTLATGTVRLVWGGGVTAISVGLGTLSVDAEIMKTFYNINVILEIVTASDAATSAVASAHLQMEG